MKKLKNIFISALFVSGIIFPVTKAFAILPLIYLAYAAAAGSELTPFLVGSATVIGTAIAVLNFHTPPSTSTPSATQQISVVLDPNTPLIVPPTWLPATSGTQEPRPPSESDPEVTVTIPANTYDSSAHTFHATSIDDAKSQVMAFISPNYPGYTLQLQYDASSHYLRLFENDPPSMEMNNYLNFAATATCKSGYTSNSSGSTCELSNSSQVKKPSDSLCEMVKKDGKFTASPNDPDCDTTTATGNGTTKLTSTASSERFEITQDASGTISIVQKTFDSGTGKTTQQATNLASNNVVSSVQTVQNSGDTTGTEGTDNGGSSGSGTSGTMNCPDCAKEVTLSNIKAILEGANSGADTAGSGMASHFDASQDSTNTANKNTLTNFIDNSGILQAYQDKVLPLSPWNQAVNGESSNCQFPFVFMGATYEISICEAQPFIHTALSFVLFIITAFGVLALVTERPEGGD